MAAQLNCKGNNTSKKIAKYRFMGLNCIGSNFPGHRLCIYPRDGWGQCWAMPPRANPWISSPWTTETSTKHLGIHLAVGLSAVAVTGHRILVDQGSQAHQQTGIQFHIHCGQIVQQVGH